MKSEEIAHHKCGPLTGGICGRGRYCTPAGWCNNGAGTDNVYRFCNGKTDLNCVVSMTCNDTGSTGKCIAKVRTKPE